MNNKDIFAFLSDWSVEINEAIARSESLCFAILSTEGELLLSNPAFNMLVKEEPKNAFINPTFDGLVKIEKSSSLIFDGFLTLRDSAFIDTSILVQVYRKNDHLLLIGGIDSQQLKKQNSLLIDFNREIVGLQREVIKKTHFLESTLNELREAKEAVSVSEDRFRTVLDSSPFAIALIDLQDQKVDYWSKTGRELFGYNPKTTDEWFQLAYPDPEYRQEVIDRWSPFLEKAKKTNLSLNTGEYRITCKDGSVKICDLFVQFIPGNMVVTIHDITDRKLIEEALRDNQKRYEKAQSMGHVGNWEFDPVTENIWGSDQAKNIYGFKSDSQEFSIEKVESCIIDRKRVHKALMDLYQKDKKYDLIFDIISADNGVRKTLHSIAEVERDEKGNPLKITGVINDITERRKAEEQIIQSKEIAETSERYLDNIINNIGDPVFVKDEESRFILVNDAFCSLFSLKRENIIGKTLADEVNSKEQDGFIRIDQEVLNTGKENLTEESLTIKGEGERIVSTRKSRFIDNNDNRFIIGIIRDITKLKTAEHDIKELNEELEERVSKRTAQLEASNKELQAFSYTVSHDLKAPLRAITGFSQILIEDYGDELNSGVKKHLNIIRENADNMGQLITDLLNLSRTGRVKLNRTKTDLNQIVKGVKNELLTGFAENDIDVVIGRLPTIMADGSLVYDAIYYLVSNAIKFSSKKSKAIIEIGSYQQEGKLVVFVKDNGIGFDMKYKDKIFEIFERLHSRDEYKGTGIGLSIVKRIITRHNGDIWVESEQGKGTSFYFTFEQ